MTEAVALPVWWRRWGRGPDGVRSAAWLVPLSWLPRAAEEPPEEALGSLCARSCSSLQAGAEPFHPSPCPGVAGEQGWCSLGRSDFGCSAIATEALEDLVIVSGVSRRGRMAPLPPVFRW